MSNKNENKTKSIVFGLGGRPEGPRGAEVFCDYLRNAGVENVEFLDCTHIIQSGHDIGYSGNVLYSLRLSKPDTRAVYCPIIQNSDRNLLLKWAREPGYETPNFIHSSTEVDPTVKEKLDQNPNAGIYIFEGAKIGPNVEIGDSTIIAWNACIGQGSKIGTAVFISPGIRLGKNCTVCSYTRVDKDVPDGSTVAGEKPMRFLKPEKKCSE